MMRHKLIFAKKCAYLPSCRQGSEVVKKLVAHLEKLKIIGVYSVNRNFECPANIDDSLACAVMVVKLVDDKRWKK